MAERFLTLMADLDDQAQNRMSGWYEKLREAGFIGTQTPGLPYHISLATFALDKEEDAVREMHMLAERFAPVTVHMSHIGMFAGGKILYAAPDMNPADLLTLQKAIKTGTIDRFPWTPHATVLMDETETVQKALPLFTDQFQPFLAKVTRLHLCAFWPTREIETVYLKGNE